MRVHLLAVAIWGTTLAQSSNEKLYNSTGPNSQRFIVEVGQSHDIAALKTVIELLPGNKVLRSFDSRVFRGFSIESTTENLDSLTSVESIVNAWASKTVQLSPVLHGQHFASDAEASNYSIHYMTGVDRLHREGILGQGVNVAVIDSGIAYNHSALGGGFGPGFKVVGGTTWWAMIVSETSFPKPDTNDSRGYPNGQRDKEPDEDPSDIEGHGTHVAGIIAGKTDSWSGVAPEANLLAYKVFGRFGGTDEDTLIEAFLMAHEDGADVITASIGGPGGWSTDAWAVIASRIVEDGTLVTISAGNGGGIGVFFGSSGSSGKFVLAVASVDAESLPALPFTATTTRANVTHTSTFGYIPFESPFSPSIRNYPVWPLSLNMSDLSAGCEGLSTSRNLSGVVVLSPLSGGCSRSTRERVMLERGARHVLFWNDTDIAMPAGSSSTVLQMGLINFDTAVNLTQTLLSGESVSLDFSTGNASNYVGIHNSAGGVASYFTSLAALYDLQIKPDIAAPGGNIFSSYLDDTFQVLSGTSMACPYIAGIAALYIGHHGGRATHGRGFARTLAMRIMSSGRAVKWSDGVTRDDYGYWAPVFQVGSGLVDAYKVLHYNTSLSWAKFALNDTDHHRRHHSVAITNGGSRRARYRFSVQPSGGLEAIDTASDTPLIQLGPDPRPPVIFKPTSMKPEVRVPEELWIEPGSTENAEFSFESPLGLTDDNLPVYSGKILISSTNAEELSVPYLGVAASIHDTFRDPFYPAFPLATSTVNFTSFRVKPYFSFNLSRESQDYPRIESAFRWGVRHLRWDIFEPGWNERNWEYPPIVGEAGYIGSATSWVNSDSVFWFDPEIHDAADTVAFPMHDLSRSMVYNFWWFGTMADGTRILPGNYSIRFAALAPFGNPHMPDDWAIFDTPEIQIMEP